MVGIDEIIKHSTEQIGKILERRYQRKQNFYANVNDDLEAIEQL